VTDLTLNKIREKEMGYVKTQWLETLIEADAHRWPEALAPVPNLLPLAELVEGRYVPAAPNELTGRIDSRGLSAMRCACCRAQGTIEFAPFTQWYRHAPQLVAGYRAFGVCRACGDSFEF
jgi:hypothetical protein